MNKTAQLINGGRTQVSEQATSAPSPQRQETGRDDLWHLDMQIPDSISEMTNSSLPIDGKDFLLVRRGRRARSFSSHAGDILHWIIPFSGWCVYVCGENCHTL